MSRVPVMKIGLLGLGKIGKRHLRSYAAIPEVSLSAYDPDAAAMRALDSPCVAKCASADELFSTPGLVAVDVCTPTGNHEASILRAFAAGLHVLCEKPLVAEAAVARRLAVAARAADRVLMVAYLFRFSPQCRAAKALLDEGVIGRPYLAFFRVGGPGSHAEWKHTSTDGGARLEKLVHLLDLAAWYFGSSGTLTTLQDLTMHPERTIHGRVVSSTVEDFLLARWSGGGVDAYLQADLASAVYAHSIEIQGTNGSIMASVVADSPVVLTCVRPTGRFPAGRTVLPSQPSDFHFHQLQHFLRLVQGEILTGHHTAEDSVILHRSLATARR